jgi:agmatine/peptidylarginine deiminase
MHWKSNSVVLHRPDQDIIYCSSECKKSNRRFYKNLAKTLEKDGNFVLTVEDPLPSIWLRDYFPAFVDGKFVRFNPCMDYMNEEQSVLYEEFNFDQIKKYLNKAKVKNVDLILDGGNLVFNETHVITSEKVLQDNKHLSKREIESRIRIAFNGRKVIYLRTESKKYDPVGHSDGIVNFLDNDTLLMADYRPVNKRLHNHNIKLLKDVFNVVILPQYFVENITAIDEKHEWYDIEGCYVNFIGTKNSLIFSKFPRKDYNDEVKELIKKHDTLNRKLHFVDTSQVTRYGGGLHCISLDYEMTPTKTQARKKR